MNLTQFYINVSRQEQQIDVLGIGIVQHLRFSGFILYALSFFLYSLFKNMGCELNTVKERFPPSWTIVAC